MRRALRWIRRLVLAAVALVLVTAIVALIVVHTDWGRERVRRRIEAALAVPFPGSTIGALTGSVLGTITLHDVKLVAGDGQVMATVDTLDVDLALAPLIGGTARVDRLIARGVIAFARKYPPPHDDGKKNTWDVELRDLEVHDATVYAATETITGIDLIADATIPAHGPIAARAMFGVTWRGRRVGGFAQLAADPAAGTIRVPLVAAGAPGAYLAVIGADVTARRGALIAQLPAADLAELAPALPFTGDAHVALSAEPRGVETRVVLGAALGAARVDGAVLVGADARSARGVIGTSEIAHARGHGRAVIAGVFDGKRAVATVIARGAATGYPGGDAIVAVNGDLAAADGLVLATGDGEARVGAVAHVTRDGDAVAIAGGAAGVSARDLATASDGLVPVRGAVALEGTAAGPVIALDVRGTVRGSRLRYTELAASSLRAKVRMIADRAHVGQAHVEVAGIVRAGMPIGALTADADSLRDGTIAVRAHGTAAKYPVIADVQGRVTLGKVIDVALGEHRLATPLGPWSGRGGRVQIAQRDVRITGIRTTQRDAWVELDATLGRGTGALSATAQAHAVPAYHGTISGTLSVARARGAWSGSGMVSGQDLRVHPAVPVLDAGATLSVTGRRVAVAVNASNPQLGGARAAVEVDGPRDLLDLAAWQRVARGDLHAIALGFDRVDVATVSRGRASGMLDGTLAIREGEPSGVVHVTGVPTPVGDASADVTLALTDVGFVDANAVAAAGPVRGATANARVAIPDHPFDPRAWRALGSRVVDRAELEATDVPIDPALLARLGVTAPYHATAHAKLEVGAGATSVTAAADLTGISGGTIVSPLDVHVTAGADGAGTRAALHVESGGGVIADLPDARAPITLARLVADPRAALAAPLSGTLTVPRRDAAELLAIVGRTDVTAGTLEGQVVAGGTVAAPTATATFDLADIHVAPRFAAKPPPALTRLHLDASWGGSSGRVTLDGAEAGAGDRTVHVEVRGAPADVTKLFADVKIHAFDIAPVVAFLPGRFAGAAGTLDVDIGVRGLDAALSRVRGTATLTDGRFPISPAVGTVRKTTAKLAITDTGITAKIDGRLGAGSVALTASTGPDALVTTVDAMLTKVAPIGALQPVIDGKLHGSFHRDGLMFTGKATVSNAAVLVPEQTGHELLDAAAPTDLVFVDVPVPHLAIGARAPEHPFLVADVDIQPVSVKVPQFTVDGRAGGKLRVSVGETLGLDGEVLVERGSADVFGHRYRVELGQLVFDGTTDGILDLKLAHDFPDVTTYVRFSGRISELQGREPEFTSDPGIYSQGQLLGFFLGGAPGGDPTKQAQEAAAGFGAALASSTIGKRVLKYLPLKLEVFRCDPTAGTSSASCTAGGWLTETIFLQYQHHLDARFDENNDSLTSEWHFKPNWELDTSGGDRNYYGTDLLWRHRW